MGLKQIIDEHPLPLLVGAVVTACTITAGTVGYLTTEKAAIERGKHTAQLQELQSRLGSIERRLGGQTQFFDVTKLVITRDKVRTLPAGITYFADADFYTSTSADPEGWTHSLSNELEIIRTLAGNDYIEALRAAMPQVPATLESSKIHLWKGPGALRVKLKLRRPGPEQLQLVPMVFVQRADPEVVRKATGVIVSEIAKKEADRRVAGALRKIASQQSAKPPGAPPSTSDPEEVGAALSALDTLYDSDLTGLMLVTQLTSGMQLATNYEKASFRVLTSQKKGNVLYLQAQIVFADAEIVGARRNGGPQRVYLDREIFFISDHRSLLMVSAMIPSVDGRNPADLWVSQWLGGLYIPLD